MPKFFAWVRSLFPIAWTLATLMWIGIAGTGIGRWVQGTFVPFRSMADIAYRTCLLILLPIAVGLVCALTIDIAVRLQLWLDRFK